LVNLFHKIIMVKLNKVILMQIKIL
jgi:hypothetical protein